MASIPLWRKSVSISSGRRICETQGIWVCGTKRIDEAVPESIKAALRSQSGFYALLSQRVEDAYIGLSNACLYFNPTNGTRKLLLTGCEAFCDEISDVRNFCSSSLTLDCVSDVVALCPQKWRSIFRRLEEKSLLRPDAAAIICAAANDEWRPLR